MDIKILFSVASVIVGFAGLVPYLRDMFRGKTRPHSYTWLIWGITQSTAATAAWYGGGGLGAINLGIGAVINLTVFGLSLKYGTKNITKIDTIALVVALLAIVVWWALDNPLVAVLMVTGIDLVGYFPSFRKSYQEPWSETVSSWLIFTISYSLAMLAFAEYNLLTMTYLISISVANLILVLICILRRPMVPKPIVIGKL